MTNLVRVTIVVRATTVLIALRRTAASVVAVRSRAARRAGI
ncbi:MAG TPA: hypothetical protein VFR11_01395 [Micromonosporaceae bacterium]|nr:hypothetical protein [Micromonosporaceae bacterium]